MQDVGCRKLSCGQQEKSWGKEFLRAIKCEDPVSCSHSSALQFAEVYSREGILQACVTVGCQRPSTEQVGHGPVMDMDRQYMFVVSMQV